MNLKTYNIWDYVKSCPLAKAIENAVNTCDRLSVQLDKIKGILGYDERVYQFFAACLGYWAKTDRYDDRNRTAVLISREIIKKFPKFPDLKGVEICEEIQKEAYGFSLFAHRYLQNELFKIIIIYLQETGREGVYDWYKACEFVIDKTEDRAVPYQEYKKTHL